MPPRGVKKGTKRARQYEHIKQSERRSGASESRAEEIAARTVNKERARSGESRTRSSTSTKDLSSGRRGGLRSGTNRGKGRTYRTALRRGQEAQRPGTIDDEQGAASARRRRAEAIATSALAQDSVGEEPWTPATTARQR